MRKSLLGLLSAAIIIGGAANTFADVYTDGNLTVDWTQQGDIFTGKLTLAAQEFPATAHITGGMVEGSFQSNGTAFPFGGALKAGTLTLTTGGKTYTLKAKTSGPVNPLGAAATDKPAAHDDAPAGYTVITKTDSGQAWAGTKADAATVRAALVATLGDLSHYFDGKPVAGGAYEDQQSHKTGGVIFTASLKGQPVRGVISTKLGQSGAEVAIVYDRADASPEDWKKLAAVPSPAAGAPAAGAPALPMNQYTFPDGTGSVCVADGWKTTAQSGLDRVLILGPADQHVAIGANFFVFAPNSQMVQMQRQLDANSRRMGFPPYPHPPALIAEFAEPGAALKELVPQLSAMNVQAGSWSMRLDEITSNTPVPANSPNGKAAILEYLITRKDHGKEIQVKNMARAECSPVGPDTWSFYAIEISSPVDTFEKDKPLMLAMVQSLKADEAGVQRVMAQRQQAQQQNFQNMQDAHQQQEARFAAQQEAHRTQMAGYEAHNKQWAADQNTTARGHDDFDEMIRGYRTVVDTQTGTKTSQDYLNVDGIVNGLNEGQPGRYVQVPLRDENDPVPGQ